MEEDVAVLSGKGLIGEGGHRHRYTTSTFVEIDNILQSAFLY